MFGKSPESLGPLESPPTLVNASLVSGPTGVVFEKLPTKVIGKKRDDPGLGPRPKLEGS